MGAEAVEAAPEEGERKEAYGELADAWRAGDGSTPCNDDAT